MGDTANMPGPQLTSTGNFSRATPGLGGCWRVRAGWKISAKAMGICHLEVRLENFSSPARGEHTERHVPPQQEERAWGHRPRVTHAGSWVRSGPGHTGHTVFPGSWVCTHTSPLGGLCDRRCLLSHRHSNRSLEWGHTTRDISGVGCRVRGAKGAKII